MQYIEEPVQDIRDLAAFFGQTGVPVALDETLDEAFAGQGIFKAASMESPEGRLHTLISQLGKGAIAGLVVKPGAIGGFERTLALSRWATMHGIRVSSPEACLRYLCSWTVFIQFAFSLKYM